MDIVRFNRLFSMLEIKQLTSRTFQIAIDLRQQRKMSLGDLLISATAIEHRLPLATHNIKDFNWIEALDVIDPLMSTLEQLTARWRSWYKHDARRNGVFKRKAHVRSLGFSVYL